MAKKVIFHAKTGEKEIIDVEDSGVTEQDLEEIRKIVLLDVMENYKAKIATSFKSSALGVEMTFSYKQQDQLSYSKWANTLALDPQKEFVIMGSLSHGVVQVTRAQFLKFMDDVENYELNLYFKRKSIEEKVKSAKSIDEIYKIDISF
jgi:hypothetical protein